MPRLTRAVLIGATITSGAAALLGLAWMSGLLPTLYDGADTALLARFAGPDVVTTVHTVAGLAGVATGIMALAGALGARGRVWAAALQLLVFGLVLQSAGTLSTVGYLVAMAMPVAIVVLLVQVVRRYRVARWAVGMPLLAGLAVGGFLARDALASIAALLGAGLAAQQTVLVAALLFIALGSLWAVVGVQALAGTSAMGRATAWVVRHRRAVTIVAATGPLPYALVRLSWLTPWPQFGEGLDLSTRIWGLTLSSGAWLGVFLTLGLIRPWGEVFPRWMPGLAGRRVPIAAAAVPGGLIAATVTFTAVPMLIMFGEQSLAQGVWGAIIFPCWYWGPALALAVWGYVAHRVEADRAGADRAGADRAAGLEPGEAAADRAAAV
ncbi:hypothetical protein GCM10010413_02290 [Promicromonospora sukumoe]|uniref:Uncharacterized protein n=1 Tax=Promicromonospora sukumoe TaxID=88382 RepID=A0A7W3PH91_9MICO|nr:hypothetical protein [Promicromonospora sukumoe]MBA8811482.1 hypothetical protein [Promicromonospora sukumoe]